MNGALLLAIINGALSLIETLLPKVAEWTKKGEITVAEQQTLLDRIAKIRSGEEFTSDEWKQD